MHLTASDHASECSAARTGSTPSTRPPTTLHPTPNYGTTPARPPARLHAPMPPPTCARPLCLHPLTTGLQSCGPQPPSQLPPVTVVLCTLVFMLVENLRASFSHAADGFWDGVRRMEAQHTPQKVAPKFTGASSVLPCPTFVPRWKPDAHHSMTRCDMHHCFPYFYAGCSDNAPPQGLQRNVPSGKRSGPWCHRRIPEVHPSP